MTRNGQHYLDSLRDGRSIFLDGQAVDDVTTHPAFAQAAKSVATLFMVKLRFLLGIARKIAETNAMKA